MSKRPNILMMMCDELRFSEVACYGHPTINTPNIDALAQRGTRFETAVSNCPVCLPARSIVLSGQYARSCIGGQGNFSWAKKDGGGIMPQWPTGRRNHLPDPTVAELLRDAGYHTAAVGKWHIEAWPDAIGFDRYLIPAHQHANTAQWFCEDGGPLFSPSGFSVDYEADRVCQFLDRSATADEPFFMYYNLSPPHMPLLDAPEQYLNMYSRDDVVLRENVDLDKPMPDWDRMSRTYLWDYRYYRDFLPYTLDLPEGCDLVELHRLYMGLTTWVDDKIGQVMNHLKKLGLDENTLVIFTADHGENLGSFQRWGKGSLNDEAMRIPMIAAGPDVQQSVSQRVSSLVDLAPTYLDAAGVDVPEHIQGRSLCPALHGEDDLSENYGIVEATQKAFGIGMRTPTHLLSLPYRSGEPHDPNAQPHELYDLTADPFEVNNLADDADAVKRLSNEREALRTWHERTPHRAMGSSA